MCETETVFFWMGKLVLETKKQVQAFTVTWRLAQLPKAVSFPFQVRPKGHLAKTMASLTLWLI